jgi:hypothetical protein
MKNIYVRKEFSPEQCAYLAGIIDGEGCIHIGCFRKITKYRKSPHFQTYINVSNTSEVLIDWLKNTFGGAKRTYTPRQTPNNSRKKVFQWAAWSDQVEHICELILPYVVIKKKEVEIMIEMRKTFKEPKLPRTVPGHGPLPISQEVLEKREFLRISLRDLHQRC